MLIVAAVFGLGVVVSGAEFAWYFDLPSLLVVILPAVFLSAGETSWKSLGGALSTAFGNTAGAAKSSIELRLELLAAKALGRYAWLSALMGTLLGLVAILVSLSRETNTDKLGPNVGVALLCLFTATFLQLFIIGPVQGRIAAVLAERE
jgi:flagellar motor component MotA